MQVTTRYEQTSRRNKIEDAPPTLGGQPFFVEVASRGLIDHPAVSQHSDTVAQIEDLFEAMGHVEDRDAIAGQIAAYRQAHGGRTSMQSGVQRRRPDAFVTRPSRAGF
jgi:hypothetical protein